MIALLAAHANGSRRYILPPADEAGIAIRVLVDRAVLTIKGSAVLGVLAGSFRPRRSSISRTDILRVVSAASENPEGWVISGGCIAPIHSASGN